MRVTAAKLPAFRGLLYRGQLRLEVSDAAGDLRICRGGVGDKGLCIRNGKPLFLTVSLGSWTFRFPCLVFNSVFDFVELLQG